MAIEFSKVKDGELYKWEKVGQKIVGQLKSYTPTPDRGKGPGHVYEVQTKEGLLPFFASILLHKKLKNIPIGKIVSIEFVSTERTSSNNTVKVFEVAFAEPTEQNMKDLGINVFTEVEDEEVDDGSEINPDDIPM